MKHHKLVIRAVIFIAAFLCFTISNAQEYNNWLLNGGGILNFNTFPATLICKKDENIVKNTIALSDDNGQIILYGYKVKSDQRLSDFVIKNSENEVIVSFYCTEVRNVIGCKLPQGGYYIAVVYRQHLFTSELHIYKFDINGKLENEFIYSDGIYTPFMTFIQEDNYEILFVYNSKYETIEKYKLTSDEVFKTEQYELKLEMFSMREIVTFNIITSLDNSKIIACTYGAVSVLNYDKTTGLISLADKFETTKFYAIAFSETDKYFLIIDDNTLKGFRFNGTFDFDTEKPDISYKLTEETISNTLWNMCLGNDGKIYIHNISSDCIMVIDGIEAGNMTSEIIQSECVKNCLNLFPQIPRLQKIQSTPCPEIEKPKIICE